MSFGVSCDYGASSSDLQVSGVSSFQVEIQQPQAPPTPPDSPQDVDRIIDDMMNAPLHLHVDEGAQGPSVVYIDRPHLDLLRKFHTRSVYTIGTANSVHVYRDVLTRMASQHSFVLHAVLRFTLMHDRYLYDPIETKPSTAESFHTYHAAALFSKQLADPIEEGVKDALWGCAALMGAASFASIEGACPYDAWPLKPPDITDLDWLKISDGKKEVWRLVDPLRETSAFKPAVEIEQNKKEQGPPRLPLHDPLLDKLYPFVTKISDVDSPPQSSSPPDPYRTPASIIEKLLPIECNHSTVMWFLSFLGHMDPRFRELLHQKDPKALLLLAWWYGKMCQYNVWWQSARMLLEGQAICLYLERQHPDKEDIMRLLSYPKMMTGLIQS